MTINDQEFRRETLRQEEEWDEFREDDADPISIQSPSDKGL